jgi:hypothetical protein
MVHQTWKEIAAMRHESTSPSASARLVRPDRISAIRAAWRTLTALTAVVGVVAFGSVAAPTAQAGGQSATQLAAAGWTCFTPPPRPDLIACYNPGQGRPLPGNPDPAPTYNVHTFSSASGEFLSTGHLVRADLYRGQPCGTEPYMFLALIGYYECVHA